MGSARQMGVVGDDIPTLIFRAGELAKQRPRGVEKVIELQRRLKKVCLDTVGDGRGPSVPPEGRARCRAMEISEELELPMPRMDSCSCVRTVGDEGGS